MKLYRLRSKWIPETSGVYFLWSKEELLYIGKAKNLNQRILQHLGNGFLQQHMVNPEELWRVSVILTKDEFDALKLESELLDLIPTKWNKTPFYKMDYYYDWRYGRGMFSEINSKDKLNNKQPQGEQE